MKTAVIFKHLSGYLAIYDTDTNKTVGKLQDTELQAYKVANSLGYVVK